MKKINLTLFIILFSNMIVFAQTIPSDTINKLLDYQKQQELSKYNPNDLKKPMMKNMLDSINKLVKGKYESTIEFNKRVDLEKKKLEILYQKELNKYKKNLKKIQTNLQRTKDNLNKKLTKTLKDSINLYLGNPTIENFDNYNADDEVFITTIVSKYLKIPVQIQISRIDAQSLDQSNNLKNLKTIIVLEYSNNNIYISEVKVKYKDRSFPVSISDLKDFNTKFKLNHKLQDTFIIWSDKKINNAIVVKKLKEIEETQRFAKDKTPNTKSGQNVLIDKNTGLIWQDEQYTKEEEKAFEKNYNYGKVQDEQGAKKYCSNLSLSGYTDWYLPKKVELQDLYNKKIYLKNGTSSYYWSSSQSLSDSENAWSVSFKNGYSDDGDKSDKLYVRCVRVGQKDT